MAYIAYEKYYENFTQATLDSVNYYRGEQICV
jgi:hypothetical protein